MKSLFVCLCVCPPPPCGGAKGPETGLKALKLGQTPCFGVFGPHIDRD